MSSVVSEAGAVRHTHASQGARNAPSAEPSDQSSPFAALLDETSDPSQAASAPPPAAPAPQLPTQKPVLRAPDARTPQASPETVPSRPKSPSDNPAPGSQNGAASAPPATSSQGNDITQSVLALGLVKAALKDTKPATSPNADTTATNGDATAGAAALDAAAAGSTAAAVTDSHDGKTSKSDSSSSDTAAAPPADPSANQANATPAQPVVVAVVISAAVIPGATTDGGSGNGSGSGTGQDAAQIAALGDAAKAAGLSGKAGTDATASGGTPGDASATAPASGKPTAPKIADAAKLIPELTPLPGQTDLTPAGSSQPNAANTSQSGSADPAATQAAIDRAHQRTTTSQPADGTDGSQPGPSNTPNANSKVDPNPDPNRDPAASASRVEDLTRQALGGAGRHGEAQTAEFNANGPARADGIPSGSTQPSPDGSLIAPATLTTAAAPAAAPASNATPITVPIAGLAVEIAAQARAGNNRFEIRLDPPELGRIDVRLDVDRDGKVTSRLVVDRQQTLDMLRRDAPELERSLQQAGLKTDGNALQFSLRDQGGFAGQNPYSNNGSPASTARVVIPDRDLAPVDVAAGYGRALGGSTGLDIRV